MLHYGRSLIDCLTSRRKPGSEFAFLRDDKGAISMLAKLRSPSACSDPLMQEKAEQDEELRVVHEDKEASRLSCKLSSGEGVEGRCGS